LFLIIGLWSLITLSQISTGAILRNLGYIYLNRETIGNYDIISVDRIRNFFEQALILDPMNKQSKLGKIRTACLELKGSELETYWHSMSPKDLRRSFILRFLVLQAQRWQANQRLEAAEWGYTELLRLESNSLEAYRGLGDIAVKRNDFDEALEYYRELEKKVPAAEVMSIQRQGTTWRAIGEFQTAVELFELTLALQPTVEEELAAYYELGQTYLASGQLDLADQAFTQVITRDPKGNVGWLAGTSLYRRGEIASRQNQPERALADFEQAARLLQRRYPEYSLVAQEAATQARQALQNAPSP